jgi:hypothetical protein
MDRAGGSCAGSQTAAMIHWDEMVLVAMNCQAGVYHVRVNSQPASQRVIPTDYIKHVCNILHWPGIAVYTLMRMFFKAMQYANLPMPPYQDQPSRDAQRIPAFSIAHIICELQLQLGA